MKLKLSLVLVSGIMLAACQPKSSNKEASDTTAIYGNPGNNQARDGNQTDTSIDKGMGDTAGIQAGGTKVNVGEDTVGKRPHDK